MDFQPHSKENYSPALRKLFSAQYAQLLDYGLKINSDQNIIEDSIQDLFLKFCENENLIIGIRNQDSYLKVSLKREILKKIEQQQKTVGTTLLDISVPSYEQMLIENQNSLQDTIKIKAGLNALTPSQKSVITLRFYKGMSYQEIADKMGSTKRTVYNQVHEAVKKMRNSMPD